MNIEIRGFNGDRVSILKDGKVYLIHRSVSIGKAIVMLKEPLTSTEVK